jgi:hypothetical protein
LKCGDLAGEILVDLKMTVDLTAIIPGALEKEDGGRLA